MAAIGYKSTQKGGDIESENLLQYIIPKDYPYNDGEKENLISFRKKLRDIPTDHASSEPKNIRFTPELNIEIDGVTTELHERWKENA